MLLPALNQAREKARAISCTGNFSSVGKAMLMYVSDNQEYFALYVNGALKSPDTRKFFYGSGEKGLFTPYIPELEKKSLGTISKLGVKGALACPSRNSDKNQRNSKSTYTIGINYQFGAGSGWGSLPENTKLSKVIQPSASMDFSEPEPLKDMYDPQLVCWAKETMPYIGFPHSSTVNCTMMDGHVEKLHKNKATKSGKFWFPEKE